MDWMIGLSTGGYSDQPLLGLLGEIHHAGIAGVELAVPAGHFDPAHEPEVQSVRQFCLTSGMHVLAVHAPYARLADPSSSELSVRQAAIGTALTAAVSVRELGGSILVAHVSDVARAAGEVENRLAHALASLSVVARACHEMHVTLAVESPLPHLVGGRVDEFEWMLDRLPPWVGVCLDISHATLGHQWDQMLALAGHRLVHVHASDHRGQADDHLPPGDGVIDWRTVGGGLTAAGYRGWIVLELAMPPGSLRAYVRRARSRLEQLLLG